jgi:hypothetical protein
MFCGNPPIGIKYLRYMNDSTDLIALNLAWFGWEIARWQDVIDWTLSAAGAVTLLAINIIRLRKLWIQQRNVDSKEK